MRRLLPVFLPLLVVPTGCNSPDYQLAPIEGVVTLDGAPLAGGVVNFQPTGRTSSAPGPGSTGRTDQQGRYRLTTINDEIGALVGMHKVKIYSYSPEDAPVGDSDVDAVASAERVPEQYNYRTQLKFEVPAAGDLEADFHLTTGAAGP